MVFSYDCMNVAIIPARGGSKGLPQKNVMSLNGLPLICHSIKAALAAMTVDKVIVSTDCPKIKEIAEAFGAIVVTRPPEISGDKASSEEALLHVLRQNKWKDGDLTIFLQCTSPLTTSADIDGTVNVLRSSEADSALAVTHFHRFLWDGHGTGINHNANCNRQLRQDIPSQYLETGAVYVMKTTGFLQHKHRFFGKIAFYVMPQYQALEIDTSFDFEMAEFLMSKYGN